MEHDRLHHIEDSIDHLIKKNKKLMYFFRWIRKNKVIRKIFIFLLVIFILWLVFLLLKKPIWNFIQANPFFNAIYNHMSYQITYRTYLGLLYAGFISALAFMSMPVEIISLYYFQNDYNTFLVISVAVLGILLAMALNYFIGYVFGGNILKYFLKHHYDDVEKKLMRYGGWMIFGLSLIISPVDLFVLVCGSMKYPFKKLMWIIFVAQTIKFLMIFVLLGFFTRTVVPFMHGLF